MKKFYLFIILFFIGGFVFAQENFKLKVDFHCPNGKTLLETKLAEVPGIIDFNVELKTKIISFNYDPKQINKDQIIAKIEEIGYYTEFSDKNKPINKACNHQHSDAEEHNDK